MFPRLKNALKGTRFDDLDDIKESVTTTLQTLHTEAFSGCFQKLLNGVSGVL